MDMSNGKLTEHVSEMSAGGFNACAHSENGQQYVEIKGLSIPSPPWSIDNTNILFAIPSNYPLGGLDAFYIEKRVTLANGQRHQRMQNEHTIFQRQWLLVSWHYTKPWNPEADNLLTHLYHCYQFIKQGERAS